MTWLDRVVGSVAPGAALRRARRPADPVRGSALMALRRSYEGVRVGDVATPAEGDTVEVDSMVYVVQGTPIRDTNQLVWTIEARPQ